LTKSYFEVLALKTGQLTPAARSARALKIKFFLTTKNAKSFTKDTKNFLLPVNLPCTYFSTQMTQIKWIYTVFL